jgi:hypothetical protein
VGVAVGYDARIGGKWVNGTLVWLVFEEGEYDSVWATEEGACQYARGRVLGGATEVRVERELLQYADRG